LNILLVEDDKDIRDSIKLHLKLEGYKVLIAEDGMKAIEIFNKKDIKTAIIDINLPVLDGIKVLEKIREKNTIPVIMLTARLNIEDKLICFKLGADDYIEKPFNIIELIARIQTHERRAYKYNEYFHPQILKVGNLQLNSEYYKFNKGDKEISLNAKEFKIIELFMKNPGRIFTKKQIYEEVWNDIYNEKWSDNTIMVYISNLRDKIEKNPKRPQLITTVRGIGYRLTKSDI
jgi:DNA-binding response OmpR family regulator